jgi:TRAP-type C4-dicarboxylate transport system permease small subunit
MGVMRKISKGFETFLGWMDGLASISIAAIMFLITADVLSRLILNKPFVGTAEIVSSIIIVVCFFEIPYVAVKDAHVRTTVLYDKVGNTGKTVINIISAVLGIVVYSLIIRASYPGFTNAIKINEAEIAGSFRITTIPGRFAIIFGSAMMVLEFINQLIKYCYELMTGKSFEGKGEVK